MVIFQHTVYNPECDVTRARQCLFRTLCVPRDSRVLLNVTSQERDNACIVLCASLGIAGRESPVACQRVHLPNDFFT